MASNGNSNGGEFDYFRIRREVTDALQRAADGKLRPRHIPLSSIRVPSTPLTKAATTLAEAELPASIFSHCLRTYYFGTIIATDIFPDLGWDPETFYLAALLHDVKCTSHAFQQSHVSFELHGGMAARTFLVDVAGAPPRLGDTVMESICRHKDVDTGSYGFSPEAQMLRFGAQLDALGYYADLIHPDTVAEVVEAYPRLDFNTVFADTLVEEAHVKRYCTSVLLLVPDGIQTVIRRNPVFKAYDNWN